MLKNFFRILTVAAILFLTAFSANAQVRDEEGNYIEEDKKVDIRIHIKNL